jgi:hypothetical protein
MSKDEDYYFGIIHKAVSVPLLILLVLMAVFKLCIVRASMKFIFPINGGIIDK